MTEPIQPHDSFFRKMFSDRETVEDILFNNLPEIAAYLLPGSLECTGESFVNAELRKYVSDLVYRARLRTGEDAFVYILFEHKSQPEPYVAFDLLRYMVRIWERSREEKGFRRFSPIVPIVFYHGKRRWYGRTDFATLFPKIEGFSKYVPSFEFCLYDLSRYSEEEIRGRVLSRIILLLMKHIYEEDFGAVHSDLRATGGVGKGAGYYGFPSNCITLCGVRNREHQRRADACRREKSIARNRRYDHADHI